MKNKCTMQPSKFIADHLVWLVTAMIWYRNVFFFGIPGMTVSQSKIILWISVLVLVALGCIITIKRRRNALSVFVNIFLPYEMYAASWTGLGFGSAQCVLIDCLHCSWRVSNKKRQAEARRMVETAN